MSGIIYRITNTVNEHIYVGKTTKTLGIRFSQHIHEAIKRNSQTHLHRAIRKYGVDVFTIELLEHTAADAIGVREEFWIANLKPHYNMTQGGDGGDTSHSLNYKLGMERRRSFSGTNNPMYGRKRDNTKQIAAMHAVAHISNKCPCMCEGIRYESVGAAQAAYPGVKIRNRLDSPKWPQFYRLRPKTLRK